MAFWLVQRIRTVMLMVRTCPESDFWDMPGSARGGMGLARAARGAGHCAGGTWQGGAGRGRAARVRQGGAWGGEHIGR